VKTFNMAAGSTFRLRPAMLQ